jgi:hypothetical protein
LCIAKASCHVVVSSAFATDTATNKVDAIIKTKALPVSGYTADKTPPTLKLFALDMDKSELTLTFDETIDAGKFDAKELTLQATTLAGTAARYDLTGGDSTKKDATTVTVTLLLKDMNAIKRNTALCTSKTSTYLSFTSAAVKDTAGTAVTAVKNGKAVVANAYVKDDTDPVIESYELDLLAGTITMQFSETVQASSIVAKEMTLRSSQSSNAVSQALAFKSLPGQDSDTLTLELSAATSNAIKKSTGLAKDLKTTYLAVTTAALTDMNKNKVASIGTDKALVASKFTADTKAPSLLQADLNMNAGELTLRFSETVQVSTFNATQIVIQNANIRDQAQSVQLSSASTSNSADGTVVIVNLSEKDTNAIKAAASLATVSNTDAFVAVTKTAIKDMNTNNVEAKALRVTAFTKDVSKPKLVDFDLNMDAKQLELRFSETVNGQTMNVKMLKFVNGKTVSTAKADFTLSPGATFTTSATHKIVVDITEADANKIKALTTLCSAKTDTFLVIDGGTVEDMRGNPVPKDSMGVDTAMVVKEFKPDGGKPTLSSFDAVMDNGAPPVKLVLKFSEALTRRRSIQAKLCCTTTPTSRTSLPLLAALRPSCKGR